jgi:hypothetical protein
MSVEDEFMGCGETPVWLPRTDFHVESIPVCTSCKIRLTAKIAGPGNVSANPEGLLVNENPTVSLTFNGTQHNLIQTIMTFPAAHRLASTTQPSEAEIMFYFQNYTEYNKILCLALPLAIGDSHPYFASLGSGITPNRPSMTSLFDKDAVFFTYRGADLRGRTADNSRPRDRCDPARTVVTYILAETAGTLSRSDYNRLIELAGSGRENCEKFKGGGVEMKELFAACMKGPYIPAGGGPAKPRTDVSINRMVKLASRILGIVLENGEEKKNKGRDGDLQTTKSMKCYKLDSEKDIKDGKVYVGGKQRPGTRTLDDELADAAADPSMSVEEITVGKSNVKPRDIETWISIAIGIVVGLIICATIIVFVLKRTFTNYGGVQKLYNVPISASQIAMRPELPSIASICPPPK